MTSTFSKILEKAGFTVQQDSKGHYLNGLIDLFGGLDTLGWLHEDYMVRLLSNAQIRKERAFTLKQLIQMAEPGDATARFTGQIAHLTAQNTLLRGYVLTCPNCALKRWYRLNQIGEQTTCQGCYQPFQLPLTLDFAFRPNPLLAEGLKSGMMTLLLTLRWMTGRYEQVEWGSGFVISGNNLNTDIDLIATCDDWLVLSQSEIDG